MFLKSRDTKRGRSRAKRPLPVCGSGQLQLENSNLSFVGTTTKKTKSCFTLSPDFHLEMGIRPLSDMNIIEQQMRIGIGEEKVQFP